jgi:hypothetical protein
VKFVKESSYVFLTIVPELSDPKQLRCVKVVKVLRLQGNPLCESGDWKEVVEAEVPGLQELNGHTGTAQGSSISCS